LIEDLLDVSRIVTGKLRLEMKPLSFRAVLNTAVESVRPAAEQSDVRIDLALDEDATIQGDQARLQQVVWNLLTNAIKFTPQGGWIRITVCRMDDRIRATVTDSGAGISKEFLPYVFDRFRQEDGAATREHAGLGIGLSIVRHLVELHGGTVTACSDGEGKGASFVVEFPIDAVAEPRPELSTVVPATRAVQ
jgi:signal transduction histidine kinase